MIYALIKTQNIFFNKTPYQIDNKESALATSYFQNQFIHDSEMDEIYYNLK